MVPGSEFVTWLVISKIWEYTVYISKTGHTVAQLVVAPRYNRKIESRFTGIFHWHNHSGRTMVLGLNLPLTEMSTRNISWEVKAVGA
jgi:hypothetical protein